MCLLFCLLLKVLTFPHQLATEPLKRGGRQVTMGGWVGGNKWSHISKLFKSVKKITAFKGGLNESIQEPAASLNRLTVLTGATTWLWISLKN